MDIMSLLEATQGYGDVFERCCDFLGKLQPEKGLPKEGASKIQRLINELQTSYALFVDELYDQIKDIKDSDKQNEMLSNLQTVLPPIIFETDMVDVDYMLDCKDRWLDKPNGYYVSEFIETIYGALLWFDKDAPYKFKRFVETFEERYESCDRICERLTIDEILDLELYKFFEYCRQQDGVPILYIQKYLEKHTNEFKPELVRLIWKNFWPWFEAEKEDFYCDSKRIEEAKERHLKNGIEIPVIAATEFVPRPKRDNETNGEYDNRIALSKEMHDNQIGKIDIHKLLSTDSVELTGLFDIKRILQDNIHGDDEDYELDIKTPTSTKRSIPLVAIKHLFHELMSLDVIRKDISDTDLARIISQLTTYSAKQVRMSMRNTMTNSAKGKLKVALQNIIDHL